MGERTTFSIGGRRTESRIFFCEHDRPNDLMQLTVGVPHIFRLSFDPLAPHRMLITGERFEKGKRPVPYTLIYDLNERRLLGEIISRVEGGAVYKSGVFQDELVYAKRLTENQDRELRYEDGYDIRSSDVKAELAPYTPRDVRVKAPLRPPPVKQARHDSPLGKPALPGMGQRVANAADATKRILSNLLSGRKVLVTEEEAERRLEICKGCEYFSGSTCSQCGCFMSWKKIFTTERCPLDPPKW